MDKDRLESNRSVIFDDAKMERSNNDGPEISHHDSIKRVGTSHKRRYPTLNPNGTSFTSYNELVKEFFSCVSLCHELLVEEEDESDNADNDNLSETHDKDPMIKKSTRLEHGKDEESTGLKRNKVKIKKMAYHGSSPDEIAICKKAKEMGVEFMNTQNG